MSYIFSVVLFASAAAAQITTSIWLPLGPASSSDDYNFQASVVAAEDDRVTMAVELSGDNPAGDSTQTITFHGTTSFENQITTTDSYGEYKGELTVSYGCSKQGSNKPVCVLSSNGPAAWSLYCEEYTSLAAIATSTDAYTSDNSDTSPNNFEQIQTEDYSDMIPDFCSTGSLLPESIAVNTLSLKSDELQTVAVTITAGEAKLRATAGATPTNSRASPTASSSIEPTKSSPGSSSGGPASSPTAPAEQSTNGAAAPMMTLAPALAGLGALVAAMM